MIHIQFFTPNRFYQTQEDTPCFPSQESDLLSAKTYFFCHDIKENAGIKYAILEQVIDGILSSKIFAYKLSNRTDGVEGRIPFCAINPIIFENSSSVLT